MQESGEDYLESILMLKNANGFVRAIDIAHKQNVSKPSVSRAMGILREQGYITIEEGQHIVLTQKGMEKASTIYSRHKLLTDFFAHIAGISEEQAEANACRVEHVIDSDVVKGIQNWMGTYNEEK
ncbi:MAG: metal-dependent transcriptional regulator [Treponema sp.]